MTVTTIDEFKNALNKNPGITIFKFSAEWCSPCKRIAPNVEAWSTQLPKNAKIIYIDIDEAFDLYAFMKSKKMLKGIPALLMYKAGNLNYVFDDCLNTSDIKELDLFFQRCIQVAKSME